jgi:uncharacterized protein YpmB
MGFSRHYYKDYNFLLSKISGDINGKMFMQEVMELNKEAEGISNLKELADCREITNVKLLSTQMTTMSAGSEKDKPGSKLAILIPKDNNAVYGLANAYRMFAEDHRESVKLFRELQEALIWLSDSDLEAKSLSALVNSA